MEDRLVSGITATGRLTLGNFLGAIKPFLKIQNQHESFIFVADLHALTIDINPKELSENRKSIFAMYLACGVNPEKTHIFFQSQIHAHTELYWLLQSRTTIGELSRMTQFKDKSKVQQENKTEKVPTGLLTYPVLMAADILLYNPKYVPVGADQLQHLELARNIAARFNNTYATNFNLPQAITAKETAKIMSLTEPTKKMSKSTTNLNSAIFLLDDPEIAYQKIQKAITDSENKIYFAEDKPGVSNLLNIFIGLSDSTKEETLEFFKDKNYKFLKEKVGELVKEFLINLQQKYYKNIENIEKIAQESAIKVNKIANENLNKIKTLMGL